MSSSQKLGWTELGWGSELNINACWCRCSRLLGPAGDKNGLSFAAGMSCMVTSCSSHQPVLRSTLNSSLIQFDVEDSLSPCLHSPCSMKEGLCDWWMIVSRASQVPRLKKMHVSGLLVD